MSIIRWLEKYPDEPVLCGTLSEVVENCTVRTFFNELQNGKPFYISGASVIFDKHPVMHDMIDNEHIRAIGLEMLLPLHLLPNFTLIQSLVYVHTHRSLWVYLKWGPISTVPWG